MKLFVTGATGFVGSVLVPELVKRRDIESLCLLKLPEEPKPEFFDNPRINVLEANLLDRPAVINGLKGYTHVIHLAGMISYIRRDFPKLEAVNVRGVQNIVDGCRQHGIRRLIHISSVGAIGFHADGRPADEEVPFNWPPYFHYMTTKYRGQQVVESAVTRRNLDAVVLNPASIMGPGDPNPDTPHNQLYHRLYKGRMVGSFSGGLAVVDVRDLAEIILKSLDRKTFHHRRFLVVGHNVSYRDLLRMMGKIAGKRVFPFRVPAGLITLTGALSEAVCRILPARPLLTYSYGKISGMRGYYDNRRSRQEFDHRYRSLEDTIRDSCRYYRRRFRAETP